MDNVFIEKLVFKSVSWLKDSGIGENIILSSRIRLARNISGITFSTNMTDKERLQVLSIVSSTINKNVIAGKLININLDLLSELNKKLLLERHIINSNFCKGEIGTGLMVDESETCSLVVNVKDHLRLQSLMPGLSLHKAWTTINEIDDNLSNYIPFAYNNTLGYLTASPINVGTGMRASVVVNLPALTMTDQLYSLSQGVSRYGFVIKKMAGDGTPYSCNLYQITNQSTLGESELQIIKCLEDITQQIVLRERSARNRLRETKHSFLEDYIGRAYGALRNSHILSLQEALDSLSILLMGADLGLLKTLKVETINELFIIVQSAHIKKYSSEESTLEEDVLRANIVRERMQSLEID